ncbi:MAG TPA: bifunctional phosphoglucose/phosphomannose isomerase [Candidatus Limnocylindria bacterium]|jgi:glucose/mannose-6-phosphate isomerase|nr:bifunctional phosphoglucose/phosphomannose isomerase [Candidatus Limnocylindria bacterium]
MSDARDFFGYKHPDEEPGRREDSAVDDASAPPQFDEAITLDNPRVIQGIDSADMVGRVRELPRQLALARRVAAAVKLPPSHTEVDAVCVLAMGGSAIGAELVEGIAGDRLRVPLTVHRDYGLPAWAGERTLVIAASHSGETVETVSGADEARRRGLPLVVISTGGALGTAAAADGTPYLRYESPGQPRAAIGFGVGLMHELLARAGLLLDPDPLGPAVEAVEALLERNAPSVETDASPAKQLAWSIFGRIPIIYGAGRMAPVAHRWKTQMNENAKAWAAFEPMPEANHNAIEGSLNPRELSDALYVVELRDPTEPPEIAARYAVVNELLGERATNRSVVWAEGPSPLARVLCGVAFGDLVSVYLAILYQTDPTPVTLLAMLKQRLARSTD